MTSLEILKYKQDMKRVYVPKIVLPPDTINDDFDNIFKAKKGKALVSKGAAEDL